MFRETKIQLNSPHDTSVPLKSTFCDKSIWPALSHMLHGSGGFITASLVFVIVGELSLLMEVLALESDWPWDVAWLKEGLVRALPVLVNVFFEVALCVTMLVCPSFSALALDWPLVEPLLWSCCSSDDIPICVLVSSLSCSAELPLFPTIDTVLVVSLPFDWVLDMVVNVEVVDVDGGSQTKFL